MLLKNIVGIIIIFIILYLCCDRNYESFTNFMILPEYQNAKCAMSCCHIGYTTMIVDDSNIGIKPSDIGTKYATTNINCDNGISNGCICKEIKK